MILGNSYHAAALNISDLFFSFKEPNLGFLQKRIETKWRQFLFCLLVWGFSSFGKRPLIEHQAYSEYSDAHNSSGKVLLLCSFIDEKTERLMVQKFTESGSKLGSNRARIEPKKSDSGAYVLSSMFYCIFI